MKTIDIPCNKLTKAILAELNELIKQGDEWQISVGPKTEDEGVPAPWDAWIEIQIDAKGIEQLVIEGSAGPQGFGYAKVVVSLDESDSFKVTVTALRDKEISADQYYRWTGGFLGKTEFIRYSLAPSLMSAGAQKPWAEIIALVVEKGKREGWMCFERADDYLIWHRNK